MGQIKKKFIDRIVLHFNFTNGWENLIKLAHCLQRYRILEKMYVKIYMILIYLKGMTNVEKSSAAKQF